MTSAEKFQKARELRDEADRLTREATEDRRRELEERPMVERLVFSAIARCVCGEGLAYDPTQRSGGEGIAEWTCSAVLLGTAVPKGEAGAVEHTPPLSSTEFRVQTENSPAAFGASTRGPGQEKPPPKEGHVTPATKESARVG